VKPPRIITPADRVLLLVVILGDEKKPNLAACALLATWPNVQDREGTRREVAERWSALSGVRVDDVLYLWDRLIGNGFVTMDGKVDPVADRYAQSLLAASVPARVRPVVEKAKPHTPAEGL